MARKHELFGVITPTGDRPEAFALCCQYMLRQTVLPTEWIIVDDGQSQPHPPLGRLEYSVKYVWRTRMPWDPQHTLPVQLLEAFKHLTVDRILIMEDDDWYRADYCERMMNMFDDHPDAELIGQGQTVYYHIPFRKCFQMVNRDRASLCQTGFRKTLLPRVIDACRTSNDPFVDLRLWRSVKEQFLLLDQPPMCVGIKGLPGRVSGQTIGHKGTARGFKPDPDGSKLRELIGEDAGLYAKFQQTPPDVPPTGENRL